MSKKRVLNAVILVGLGMSSLAAEKNLTAEVRSVNGTPMLFINGKPHNPLINRPNFFRYTRTAVPVRVTREWQRFETTFVMPEDQPNVSVHVCIGLKAGTTVWVDDVSLVDINQPEKNLIRNGDFSDTNWEKEWFLNTEVEEGAKATARVEDGALRLDVDSGGKEFWHVHIFYIDRLNLKKGHRYTYSLRLRANKGRILHIAVAEGGVSDGIHYTEKGIERMLRTIEYSVREGVHIHEFGMGEEVPWPKPGENPDYRRIELMIERLLLQDPQALLIPRITLRTPSWWKEAHPDELMQWWDPEKNKMVRHIHCSGEGRIVSEASIGSELWRREANEHLRRLIEHLESKYGNHIIGYHITGQTANEWFYHGSHDRVLTCCEPVFATSWRKWLKEKYKNEDALRKSWGDPGITFEKVTIPSPEERLKASFGYFRDPRKERKVIDFHEYQNVAIVEVLEQFAKTIKQATKGRKLVVFFNGYLFDLGFQPHGLQQSGHLALKRLLRCPDVDIICSPISYGDRGAGGMGAFMAPVDSVSLHGKLWLNEDDTRTHISSKDAGYGRTETPEETYGVHQRNFAHIFTRRMTCWWTGFFPENSWLCDDGIWQNLGKLKRLYDSVLGKPSSFKPEIAVIVDEKSNFYLTQKTPPVTGYPLYHTRKWLYRIGAPCGFYLLDDLTAGRVPKAKLYIFLNCFALTEEERKAIAKQCKDKVCIFFYANGFIKDPSADVKNMETLLGTPMKMGSKGIFGRVKVVAHPLTEGVSDFGIGYYSLFPVFYLDEERAGKVAKVEVLANYQANGLPAVWMRRGKPYTAVYIGALTAPASFFRNIAKMAGVHIYCDTDDVITADAEFLAIHASSEGEKQLMLRRKATVQDTLSGEVVGVNIKTWRVKMQKGETRIYKIK